MQLKNIILGISGSIAAYKAIDLAKLMIEAGYEVKIILSSSAPNFVSPLSLKSLFPGKVYLPNDTLNEKDEMLHITLAKEADLILIAPASANMIAKLAGGYADCLLSNTCIAFDKTIAIAPAMNKTMWENSIVQDNIAKLRKHKFHIIEPALGPQACGDFGYGRMQEPAEILDYVVSLGMPQYFTNKNLVITARPTIEKIDPVRFISNYSSGKMGYAIAKVASQMGAKVTLISGPTSIKPYSQLNTIYVESADQMYEETCKALEKADLFIGVAAVADYKPASYNSQKIKKTKDFYQLKLTPNIDIIGGVKQKFPKLTCVGFAAETHNIKEFGLKKLQNKNLDMVIINDVSDSKVFGKDENEVHIFTKDQEYFFIERNTKDKVAINILELIAKKILKLI